MSSLLCCQGKHPAHLESHVCVHHKTVYNKAQERKQEEKSAVLLKRTKENEECKGLDGKNFVTHLRKRKRNINVYIDPNDIHDGIMEMVAVDGLPLSIVESAGFRKIIQPLLNAIPDATIKRYNRHNIRTSILNKADDLKKHMSRLMKGNLPLNSLLLLLMCISVV